MFRKRFIDEKREHLKRLIIAMTERTKPIAELGLAYRTFRDN